MKIWSWIFLSLLLHAVWLISWRLLPAEQKLKNNTKVTSVEVDFIKGEDQSGDKTKLVVPQSAKSLSDFLPKTDLAGSFLNQPLKSETEKLEEEVELLPFFDKIWGSVDQKIYYPTLFNQLLVQGSVRLRVLVGEDGSLKARPHVISSSNKHIEAFTLYCVLQALREPLHQRFWLKSKGGISLELNFDYLLSFQKITPPQKNKISEYELYFSRQDINPEAHPGEALIPDYLPVGGGSMLNLVKAFNIISGRDQKMKQKKKKELHDFYKKNVNFIESFKSGKT